MDFSDIIAASIGQAIEQFAQLVRVVARQKEELPEGFSDKPPDGSTNRRERNRIGEPCAICCQGKVTTLGTEGAFSPPFQPVITG